MNKLLFHGYKDDVFNPINIDNGAVLDRFTFTKDIILEVEQEYNYLIIEALNIKKMICIRLFI